MADGPAFRQRPRGPVRADHRGRAGDSRCGSPGADAEPDEEAQAIADEAHLARTVRGVSDLSQEGVRRGEAERGHHQPGEGRQGPADAYLKWRRSQVQAENAAQAELETAGKAAGFEGELLDARVKELVGVSIEAATVSQMKEATAKLASPAGAPA